MQQELIHRIFLKRNDLANLITGVDIDKLENVPISLSNLKGKVNKLDVNKLVPSPVDLSKLIDAAKNDVVKKDI